MAVGTRVLFSVPLLRESNVPLCSGMARPWLCSLPYLPAQRIALAHASGLRLPVSPVALREREDKPRDDVTCRRGASYSSDVP